MITEGRFNVPIYDFKVEVTVFDTPEEARKKYSEWITGTCLGCTVEYFSGDKCKLIIPSYNMSTVIHELEHVKNLIWKYREIKTILENDEPDAYLIGFLFEKVEKILKRHLASKC